MGKLILHDVCSYKQRETQQFYIYVLRRELTTTTYIKNIHPINICHTPVKKRKINGGG